MAEPVQNGVSEGEPSSSERLISLAPGTEFYPEDANARAGSDLCRVIILAGEVDSGKTTLLASIYEQFCEGPFAALLFAGSDTLVAWEQRCHRSRVASGAETPDTERTKGLDHRFLHIAVRPADLKQHAQHLLFSDFPGELFDLIRDSTEECQKLTLLKRADHFVVLLDGARLAIQRERLGVLHSGAALLRSCIDSGMLGKRSLVDVIFTKDDLLRGGGAATEEFLSFCQQYLDERVRKNVGGLRFLRVAASPQVGAVPFAFGVDEMFRVWVNQSHLFDLEPARLVLPAGASEFDRMALKVANGRSQVTEHE